MILHNDFRRSISDPKCICWRILSKLTNDASGAFALPATHSIELISFFIFYRGSAESQRVVQLRQNLEKKKNRAGYSYWSWIISKPLGTRIEYEHQQKNEAKEDKCNNTSIVHIQRKYIR